MSSILQKEILSYPLLTSQELANLCGVFHENIKYIEQYLEVKIQIAANEALLYGANQNLMQAKRIILALHQLAKAPILLETVKSYLNLKEPKKLMNQTVKLARKTIIPRNTKQADYLAAINQYDITFAVGPAGTGKTYLAVSKALESFAQGDVHRLIFVRPAVEAGEKLGFLPGDLVEKVLPYLRPIYDALYEMIGFKETQRLIQNDIIEILPLAFMRGRTLNESFIILDEAQNTTMMQMKMFLTRMGFGSKTVVTGDMTQVDLPKGIESGLAHAVRLFKDLSQISIHHFTSKEVVRHPLVSQIVEHYEMQGKKIKNDE